MANSLLSNVLVVVVAGFVGSVVLRSGSWSAILLQLQCLVLYGLLYNNNNNNVLSQLIGVILNSPLILLSGLLSLSHELIRGVNEVEISPNLYNTSLLAAQIEQLAQKIRRLTLSRLVIIFSQLTLSTPATIFSRLTLSRPVTIFNGKFASYIVRAAVVGAIGYCCMRWKGWSFSDIMFVTKRYMEIAVANISKQLELVSAALASTKRHLTRRLKKLDVKMNKQKKRSKVILNEVREVKSYLSQIRFDIQTIHNMVTGLEGKIGLLESKQDVTYSSIRYLCKFAGGIKKGLNAKHFQVDTSVKPLLERASATYEEKSLKGLRNIVEPTETSKVIHREYPIGLSFAWEI